MIPAIIGFAASSISVVLWWPQAVRVWGNRHNPTALYGVSIPTQVLLICNATLWFVYAIITEAFWAGAPGLLNLPLAVVTIAIILRSRKIQAALAPTTGDGYLPGEPNCHVPGLSGMCACDWPKPLLSEQASSARNPQEA